MSRRLLASLALVAFAALGLAVPAVAATAPGDPCWTPAPWTSMSQPDCPPPTNPAPVQDQPTPQPSAAPTTAPAPAAADPTPAPAATGAKPSTAAEEWAGGAAEGVPKVVDDIKDRYQNPPLLSTDSYRIYAVMFGIGSVIYFVALTVAFTKAGKGGPRQRAELWDSMPKLVLYVPVLAIAPGLVAVLYNEGAQPIGAVAAAQSADSFVKFLDAAGATFAQNPLDIFALLGGAVAALFIALATLGVLFAWLIADIAAQFAVYLLVAVLPIAGALSLFPRWWRMAGRTVGLLVGVTLIPVVLRVGFWVMWEFMGGQIGATSGLIGPLTMLVVFGISTSAPILMSHLMPMVLPQGGTAYGNTGGSARAHGAQALQRGGNAVRSLASRGGSGASGGQAAAAGGGKAAAGAGASGAAVAGGVVLGALVAAGAAANAVVASGKSAAGQALAASGGGMTSDHEGGTLPLPAGRGAGPRPTPTKPARPNGTRPNPAVATAPPRAAVTPAPPGPSGSAPSSAGPAPTPPSALPGTPLPHQPTPNAEQSPAYLEPHGPHAGPDYAGSTLPDPPPEPDRTPATPHQTDTGPQWDDSTPHPEARFMPLLAPPAPMPVPPQPRRRNP